MHVSSQKLLLIALFASVCGSVVTSRPASALPTPGENDVFERRYRGDDEVGDSDRGGGRGGGRGGSSNDNDSRSGGGGRSG
ncbi:MAG: hypothetical protein ABL907_17110, partial [Hyphomicrobium sp.]